jgi:hypothetical protein
MKTLLALCLLMLPVVAQEHAAKHELAFQLSGIAPISRTSSDAGNLNLGAGVALQTNYAHRLIEWRRAALYGEVHFLASPLREVTSSISNGPAMWRASMSRPVSASSWRRYRACRRIWQRALVPRGTSRAPSS